MLLIVLALKKLYFVQLCREFQLALI
uniref:Unconventional myosin-xv isoform x1 n=1 Tax=Triatoma infestans TaxID=30076 RepID=A0A170U4G0_TRIIF